MNFAHATRQRNGSPRNAASTSLAMSTAATILSFYSLGTDVRCGDYIGMRHQIWSNQAAPVKRHPAQRQQPDRSSVQEARQLHPAAPHALWTPGGLLVSSFETQLNLPCHAFVESVEHGMKYSLSGRITSSRERG